MEKINKITISPLDLILELKEYKNKISFINQTNDSKIQKLLYFFFKIYPKYIQVLEIFLLIFLKIVMEIFNFL